MSKMFQLILFLASSALLWAMYSLAYALGFPDSAALTIALWSLAVVATALSVVAVLGRVLLVLLSESAGDAAIAPITRTLVYGILATAACGVLIVIFGGNPLTLATTSAVFSIFLGLAVQPTLSGIISGVILQFERRVVPGAWIEVDKVVFQVEATGWRAVVGRSANLHTVILPNTKLVSEVVLRRPDDRPTQSTFTFLASIDLAPHIVTEIVAGAVVLMPRIVATMPVAVLPVEIMTDRGAIRYCVSYAIYSYDERSDVEAVIMQRLWYAFQRHGAPMRLIDSDIAVPAPLGVPELRLEQIERLRIEALGESPDLALVGAIIGKPAIFVELAREHGTTLMYGPYELIVVPAAYADHVFVLIDGALQHHDNLLLGFNVYGSEAKRYLGPASAYALSPFAILATIAQRLAAEIGPAAEMEIRRLAERSADLPELCQKAAQLIPDAAARARFLAEAMPESRSQKPPGVIFRVRRDVTGSYGPPTPLRSAHHATIVAIPAEWCRRAALEGERPPH